MMRIPARLQVPASRRHIGVAAVIAGCLLGMGEVLFSQEPPPTAGVQLVLEAEKTRFVEGEPVYVTVRLRNVGSTVVDSFKVLDPRAGAIRVVIETPDRPRLVFLPLSLVDVEGGVSKLEPDRELTTVIPIFYGGLKWSFPQPGTYTVAATYRHSKTMSSQAVRSNSITLSVTQGDGAGRLLMEDTRAGEETGKFLVWQQGDHLLQGLERLTRLLTNYPNSPITDYVRLALGHNLSRTFRDYSMGKTRRQDCARALAYLDQVRSDRLPRYLQVQKHLDDARCRYASGQSTQSSEALAEARVLSRDRGEYQPLFEQAMRLEPALQALQR